MNQTKNFKGTKIACYITNISMAAVGILSPLLFETFKGDYDISNTLLGLLVVMNFCTQLFIDLIFTFFSSKFNIKKVIIIMPLLTVAGLLIYAIMPMFLPKLIYLWLSIGTVVFSISAGLSEVLISPIIAAIPSDNPDREMSKLHSVYAWGLVGVVIVGTLLLKLFEIISLKWNFLAIAFALIPLTSFLLFARFPLPEIQLGEQEKEKKTVGKSKLFSIGILLCFACIFFGGAAEGTMTQWISSYIESTLELPKLIGDILGMALFALMLALGRTLYAKLGKNILNIMLLGMAGSVLCYVIAGISSNVFIGLIACIVTGLCVSMLWPGNIILIGEKFPTAGVAAYALMAAGGDLGCSLSPQLMGIIADVVSGSDIGAKIASSLKMTADQIGMRAGLLFSALFPILGLIIAIVMKIYFKRKKI